MSNFLKQLEMVRDGFRNRLNPQQQKDYDSFTFENQIGIVVRSCNGFSKK